MLVKKADYHRPLIFNGLLWSLAFIILLFIFSKGKMPITVDYIYTIAFLIVMAIPVSINFYVLIPKFLKQERYILYIVLFTINVVSFSVLHNLFFQSVLDVTFPNLFFISYLSNVNTYIIFSIFLVVTTLFKLTEDWFYFNTDENRILRFRNQQIETQLSSLRAQINPHFLFNSLNVIYALALEQKQGITKAIVQLSDILRYVIYDSDTERVTLKDEIKLLQNYIAFQKHRVQATSAVNFKVNIENEDFKIYPMLLLPLVENSFKYGVSDTDASKWITIEMIQHHNEFICTVENANTDTNTKLDEDYSGVGLKNLRNNLNLVYPNTHELNIEDHPMTFKVILKIVNDNE